MGCRPEKEGHLPEVTQPTRHREMSFTLSCDPLFPPPPQDELYHLADCEVNQKTPYKDKVCPRTLWDLRTSRLGESQGESQGCRTSRYPEPPSP